MGRLIVAGAQRRQPLVTHQHQEALLGKIGGCRWVEAARPILDGIEPVGWERLPSREARRVSACGESPLTG